MSDAGKAIFNHHVHVGGNLTGDFAATFQELAVDSIGLNTKTITITGSTDDTFSITAGTNGATTIATVDDAANAGHITVAPDGYIILNPSVNGTYFQLGGTSYGLAGTNGSTTQFLLRSMVSDGDLIIQGNDGGSTINALTFDMSNAGAASFNDDVTVGDNIFLASDSSVIFFGASNEIKLTHIHNSGLSLKHTATADDNPIILTLQTGETDIEANDVIGAINFQAPDEGTGTDAILVAAGIEAVSEGDFSSSNNATKLSFKTGASEAAAEKMSLSSVGILTIADDFMIKDGGTIGVASTNDAITISSAGIVTFKDDILIKDGGTIGSASDTDALSITSAGNIGINTTSPAKKLSVNGPALATISALSDGATITPDFDTSQNFSVTLGGNRTLANPNNIDAGQTGSIFVTQDGTGSRTLAFGIIFPFCGWYCSNSDHNGKRLLIELII